MTFDSFFIFPDANVGLLDSELRAALNGAIAGFSYRNPAITVHFLAEPSQPQLDTAAATVAAHNPAALTAQQQLAAMTEQAKTDTLLSELRRMTPAQAEQWVINNVNDLATAKTVLAKMARIVAYLMLHAELRGE